MGIIVLDIGASSIKAGIATQNGRIFNRISNEEQIHLETNDFAEIKHNTIELCKKKISEGADKIVGISTAGSVDNSGVVISAGNFKNYCNISWEDLLSEELGKMMVSTINDGRASAWGEYVVSEDKANTHVHVVIGTGIGGGVIHNGELLKGDSGQAGYIGHIKVTPLKTPICSCGKMGCVESLASARGIVSFYNKKVGGQASFDEMMGNVMNDTEAVIAAFDEGGYWLGVALGNVMNVLNPQCITIGGGVLLAANNIMSLLKVEDNPYLIGVKKGVNYAAHRRVEATGHIICGVLGNSAGLIGAANLVAKKAQLI